MENSINIIPYKPEFCADVARLEAECFSEPWSEKAIDESFRFGTVFFLAETKGEIIGYVGIKPILDEGYITNVAVSKSYRRRGAARLLMKAVSDFAKAQGLASVSLEVRVSNVPAIALYESFGYKTVGKRKNFYSHPTEDGVLMTLYLP